MIVLDASLMIEWLVGNDTRPDMPHLHDVLSDIEIAVPAHWPIEISNFLRTDIRSKKMTAGDIQFMMERLDTLQILIDSPLELDEIGPLAFFANQHGLTTYDAAYVQLAYQRKAVLGSLDIAMRTAAQSLDIALLPA